MKTIYYNGQVYTGSLPLVQAFIEEEGKFTFSGTSQEALKQKEEGDLLVDLNGRFVCSGFNDSHMHLLGFGRRCVQGLPFGLNGIQPCLVFRAASQILLFRDAIFFVQVQQLATLSLNGFLLFL